MREANFSKNTINWDELKKSSEDDIHFNCGCRDWRITPVDEKGVKEQPPGTVVDHQCAKVIVYRDYRGLKRYFARS